MTESDDDRSPAPPFRTIWTRIPPEDKAMLLMIFVEVVSSLWQQERAKWSMRTQSTQRSVEFALGQEGGFTRMLRGSKRKR